MNISGNTVIVVKGKPTRVCGRIFNEALKVDGQDLCCRLPTGEVLFPSADKSWAEVAQAIKDGKKVVAKALKTA